MTDRAPKAPIPTWLHGCTGRMGLEIQEALLESPKDFALVGGSGHDFIGRLPERQVIGESLADALAAADLIIDFSSVAGNKALLDALSESKGKGKAILIGTTGLPDAQIERWRALGRTHGHRVVVAPNTSLGVLTLTQACLRMAKTFRGQNFDIEIYEAHHRAKVDAPSGTAKFIANAIAEQEGLKVTYCRTGKREPNELGVVAVRGGSVFGEHTVRFMGDHEEVAISHTAFSRKLFAKGALSLGQLATRQGPGYYELFDLDLGG